MDLGIYIHIPYCVKKCNYCDFKSYSCMDDTIQEYFAILCDEIKYYADIKNKIDTIFIGGGTPSIVDAKYINDVLNTIYKYYNIKENCEISIECNPGTVTEDKISSYSECGINRISFGLQTADENELKVLGRIHTFKDYEESINHAVKAGFKNINTDIITGAPGQTMESLSITLDKISLFPLTHISAYSLIIEEGTSFYRLFKDGQLGLPNEDEERRMYDYAADYLKNKGYCHYEISNFAKKGYECKHNTKYWQAKEYLGFGTAAHSYFNGKRYWNYDTIDKYIDSGRHLSFREGFETIDKNESMKEFMMLGLRMTAGVDIGEFKVRYGEDLKNIFQSEIKKLSDTDLIEIDGDIVKLTEKGLNFANIAFMEFI